MTTPLEQLGRPLVYEVADDERFDTPTPQLDQAQRARVRSVAGMQKEALVTNSVSGKTWRLVSDEGDYLDGDDIAPPPLAFMSTGIVASFTNEILALADQRGIDVDDFELSVDNYYTMNGSALAGTMTGGALPLDVHATIDADAGQSDLEKLVAEAIRMSPVYGLIKGEHDSVFTLSANGEELEPNRVDELDVTPETDPNETFEELSRKAASSDRSLLHNTDRKADPPDAEDRKYTEGQGSSLEEEQDRLLHIRGVCTIDEDGVKNIETHLFSPVGTVFVLRSDEPESQGGNGRAPDAMSYIAAGLGFCFMTQFGRYADIVGKDLSDYRIVQDTHFSVGGASGGTGELGQSEPVQTHVFLNTPEDEAFAREVLDMSEQTCFLHALCRTDLDEPDVSVTVV